MEKERKPLWFRLLKRLLCFVLSIVVVLIGIYAFFRIKYNVNLFSVYKDVKQMTRVVDEKQTFADVFTDDDLPIMKVAINSSIPDYITDDYKVNKPVYAYGLEQDLKLTNKNLGQFVNLLIEDKSSQVVQMAGNNIHFDMIQVGFYNFDAENNTAVFSVVLKLDMRDVKDDFTGFPLSMLKKVVTDDFYITVNVTVKKESPSFSYTLSGGELLLNSLSSKQSAELLKALSIFSELQSTEDQARSIANPILEVLLDGMKGMKENCFARFLKEDFDCTDYIFETENNETFLVYKKKVV